jgi:hypothetical protein
VLTVSAGSTTLSSGQTTSITATLTNSGQAVAGQTLTFVLGTNLSGGSLSTATATTGSNGQASVTYTAGTLGGNDTVVVSSSISSSSGTATPVGSATIAVTPVAGSGGTQYSIALSSVGGTTLATGASSEIVATVTNSSGTTIANQPVSFSFSTSVTGGNLSSGTSSGSSVTANTATGSGQAGVLYTAGSTTGTDIVTASVTDSSGHTATASIALNVVSGNATNITLTLSPSSTQTVGPNSACNGVQTVNSFVPLVANVVNAGTTTPATGITVTFAMGSVTSSGYLADTCSTATPKPEVLVSGGIKSPSAQVVQSLSSTTTDASGNVYADYVSGGTFGATIFDTVIVTVSRSGVILGSKSVLVNVN